MDVALSNKSEYSIELDTESDMDMDIEMDMDDGYGQFVIIDDHHESMRTIKRYRPSTHRVVSPMCRQKSNRTECSRLNDSFIFAIVNYLDKIIQYFQ